MFSLQVVLKMSMDEGSRIDRDEKRITSTPIISFLDYDLDFVLTCETFEKVMLC